MLNLQHFLRTILTKGEIIPPSFIHTYFVFFINVQEFIITKYFDCNLYITAYIIQLVESRSCTASQTALRYSGYATLVLLLKRMWRSVGFQYHHMCLTWNLLQQESHQILCTLMKRLLGKCTDIPE